jgi:HK97 family phage major capsid protein
MSILDQATARLDDVRAEVASLHDQRSALVDAGISEKRGLSDAEEKSFSDLGAKRDAAARQIASLEERVVQLKAEEVRESAAASTRKTVGGAKVTDPAVYTRDGFNGNSYFRDLAHATLQNDRGATDRLVRSARATLDEVRTIPSNFNAGSGSGGEFAPPSWLVADYVQLTRAGRTTANLYRNLPIPAGVSSVNIPKLVTGSAAAIRTDATTGLTETDLTTGSVGTGFSTVGGVQTVSQQLLDQSAIGFDQVVNADLTSAYAYQLGNQVMNGTGTGANNNSVVNGLINALVAPSTCAGTFTSSTPLASEFYHSLGGLLAAFTSERFEAPTAIIMHPRRLYWLLSRTDTTYRPLVVPSTSNAFNPLASSGPDPVRPPGDTGVSILGIPVHTDPFIPTNLGVGAEDQVFLVKGDDLWLYESAPQFEAFREPGAAAMTVLFRVYGYVGTVLNRVYRATATGSVATLNGTGLTIPTWTA